MNQTMHSSSDFLIKSHEGCFGIQVQFPDTEGEVKVFTNAEPSVIQGTVSAFFLKWRAERKDYNVRKEISKVVTSKNASGVQVRVSGHGWEFCWKDGS